MRVEKVQKLINNTLLEIELATNSERELIIGWAHSMRDMGIGGLAWVEVMIGVHNKCVLEYRDADEHWDKVELFVV